MILYTSTIGSLALVVRAIFTGSGNKMFTAIHVEMTDILSDMCSTFPVATSLSDSDENYANDSSVAAAYCSIAWGWCQGGVR